MNEPSSRRTTLQPPTLNLPQRAQDQRPSTPDPIIKQEEVDERERSLPSLNCAPTFPWITDDARVSCTAVLEADIGERIRRLLPLGLRSYILDNVILLFRPITPGPPRIRPLKVCFSVQRLFAHANAAGVFPTKPHPKQVRTLTLRLANDAAFVRTGGLCLVEDDDEDFRDVIDAIMGAAWWEEAGGAIQGSGTVEVRGLF